MALILRHKSKFAPQRVSRRSVIEITGWRKLPGRFWFGDLPFDKLKLDTAS